MKEELKREENVENYVENVETHAISMFLQGENVENLVDNRGKRGNNKNVLWKTHPQ